MNQKLKEKTKMKTLKELNKDFLDAGDYSYKLALIDILELIEETVECHDCKRRLKARIEGEKLNCSFCNDTKQLEIKELDGTITTGICPQCFEEEKLK